MLFCISLKTDKPSWTTNSQATVQYHYCLFVGILNVSIFKLDFQMTCYIFGGAISDSSVWMICFICVCGEFRKDLFYRLFPNKPLQVWRGFEKNLLASLVCEETAELVLACSSDTGTEPRISNNGQGFSLHDLRFWLGCSIFEAKVSKVVTVGCLVLSFRQTQV